MTRYWESAGVYHERQRCTRAHATGDRVREVETTDGLDACPVCVDDDSGGMHERDVAQLIEAGVCPWCEGEDGYEGDYVGQHASSQHAEAWAEYKSD